MQDAGWWDPSVEDRAISRPLLPRGLTAANQNASPELRNRGVKDIFIACVDGLKGFPQAIETVFPQAQVQLCIVHLVRASLNYVSWRERKQVAQDLKSVYRAATEEQARRGPLGEP
jgi:transposase-like protein